MLIGTAARPNLKNPPVPLLGGYGDAGCTTKFYARPRIRLN